MGYDVLVLTDHRGHSDENSVYALASALAGHEKILSVDIASRGCEENTLFFSGQTDAVISVIPAIPGMDRQTAAGLLTSSASETEITDYDFILLRLPPPIPGDFFNALAESFPADHIINNPAGIMRTSSKAFLLEVADLCPPVCLVNTPGEVTDFMRAFPIVLKPLNGYGGAGIIRCEDGFAENFHGQREPLSTFFTHWSPPYLAMQFLPRVTEGDKRTIVVNGKIMGSSLRRAKPGGWICNVARGGSADHAVADADEIALAENLSKVLRPHGIIIFGFDTLVDSDGRRVLSEINAMSIGGLKQTCDPYGEPILSSVVNQLVPHMERTWFGKPVNPDV